MGRRLLGHIQVSKHWQAAHDRLLTRLTVFRIYDEPASSTISQPGGCAVGISQLIPTSTLMTAYRSHMALKARRSAQAMCDEEWNYMFYLPRWRSHHNNFSTRYIIIIVSTISCF
jgi:hypothetical protein